MRSTVSAWIVLTTGLKIDTVDYATLWMRFKMATSEIKAKYPFRMRAYDDDGGFIKESRTIDPSTDNYDVAVNIGDRNEYRYGATHFRWYKGSRLVAVYLTEFGSVYGPKSIAKGDCPPSTYVGGQQ